MSLSPDDDLLARRRQAVREALTSEQLVTFDEVRARPPVGGMSGEGLQKYTGWRPPQTYELSDAQLDALKAISHGLTEGEAGELLGVTREAINDRLREARRKFAAKTSGHAACNAIRQGLIP